MAGKQKADLVFKNAKPKAVGYHVPDDLGLSLFVTPTGGKHWRFRYTLHGADHRCAFGPYPEIDLKTAREERDKARALVARGIKPQGLRGRRNSASSNAPDSFRSVAVEWMAKKRTSGRGWTDGYHQQVLRTLERDVFPKIGGKRLCDITAPDYRDVLDAIEGRSGAGSVALLVQQWCVAIGQFGVVRGKSEFNVAASLKGYVSRRAPKSKVPLTTHELRTFFSKVRESRGVRSVGIALLLLAHTFVRPSELRCARWSEFDLSSDLWTVPASRMKMRREHKVPLTPQVKDLLDELRRASAHQVLLFPNLRSPDQPMSPTTLNRRLERLGYSGRLSAHGFRSTASTMLNEWGCNPEAIELQLAHVERSKTRLAYNKAELLAERRAIMERWSLHLETIAAS